MGMTGSSRKTAHFPHLICTENRTLSIVPDARLVFRDPREEQAHLYLAGFSLCTDLLQTGRGTPAAESGMDPQDEFYTFEQIIHADARFWEMRRMQIHAALTAMPTTRESTLLYCRYIKRESIESVADKMGISRRSAYRMYHRALVAFSNFLDRIR